MRGPGRSLRLAAVFLRVSAMNELQYRANLLVQLFQSVIALATGLAVLGLVFSHTRELGGWSPAQLLAVMGVHIMVGGVVRTAIQPNMLRLIEDVREGKLDYVLVKPRDGQLLVSIRELSIWQSVDCVVGAVVIGVAVARLAAPAGIWQALGFAAAMLLGVLTIYCFWLLLSVGAFWVVRLEFIVELFEGVYQAGRWPVAIYPAGLRVLLTFLVPLAFAVTVPAQVIAGLATAGTLLAALAFTVALTALTRWAWKLGLRARPSSCSPPLCGAMRPDRRATTVPFQPTKVICES
jgi:ABC-2 type transport system permease protein